MAWRSSQNEMAWANATARRGVGGARWHRRVAYQRRSRSAGGIGALCGSAA